MQTQSNSSLLRWLAVCALATLPAAAQKYTPPPPPLTTAPCVPTKKLPCLPPATPPPSAAEAFPFPGEPPAESAPAAAPGTDPAKPVTPADAAQVHPFPGEPPSSAESSSSSSSSAPSDGTSAASPPDGSAPPVLQDKGSSGSSRFARKHLAKLQGSDKDREDREGEDLDVSRYYASTGDYHAAYLRAKDAVVTLPADPEAHFLLAEMADRSKKPDEAEAEYRTYLKLEPDGDHVAAANRALEKLAGRPAGK